MIRILKRGLEEPKLVKLARNIHKIVHNAIITNFSDISSDDLSQLCLFSIEILKESKTLIDLFKQELPEYFKSFNYLQLSLKDQRDIYRYATKLIIAEIANKELLEDFFNLLNILLQNHLKLNKITEIRELIFDTMKDFKSIKNLDDDVRNVFIIMENVILLICSEDQYGNYVKNNLPVIDTAFEVIYNKKRFLATIPAFLKFLHLIQYYMMQNLRNFTNRFWSEFNIESLVILSRFSNRVAISLASVQQRCKNCDDCLLNYDLFSAVSICIIPVYMLKYCLSNDNKSEIAAICTEINHALELSCTLVLKMQEFTCSNWKTVWIELGTLLYNFSVILSRSQHEKAIFYAVFFVKKLILIEGVKNTILKRHILSSTLLNLVETYIKQKEYLKAMAICAFNMVLHSDNRESPFWQWVRIKSTRKEDEVIQNTNTVSVIEKNQSFLSNLYAGFTITETEKINLLLFELRQYKKIWPSKISLACVYKELITRGDTMAIAEALASTWTNEATGLPTDLYDNVFEIAQKFESEILASENTADNNFLMAFLYLTQYYVTYQKAQQKIRVDMEGTRVEVIDVESTTDKNDQCDIFSSYESLTVEVNIKIIKYLKKSLDIFKSVVNEANKNILIKRNIYLAVTSIANEYLLHCQTFNYLEAWLLAYKIVKILDHKISIIESIAHLVEKSDPNSKFIKDALVEAEALIKQVDKINEEDVNAPRKSVVICNFYIVRGLVCLNCGDAKGALNSFKEAKLIYDKQKDVEPFELLRVKYEFFEWKLQLLPCSFKVDGHSDVLIKANYLMELISQSYKKNGNYFIIFISYHYLSLFHHAREIFKEEFVSYINK